MKIFSQDVSAVNELDKTLREIGFSRVMQVISNHDDGGFIGASGEYVVCVNGINIRYHYCMNANALVDGTFFRQDTRSNLKVSIPFDEIFPYLSENIRNKILYHLNLFT